MRREVVFYAGTIIGRTWEEWVTSKERDERLLAVGDGEVKTRTWWMLGVTADGKRRGRWHLIKRQWRLLTALRDLSARIDLLGSRSPSGCAQQHGRESGDDVRDRVRGVMEVRWQRALFLHHVPPAQPGTWLIPASSWRSVARGLPSCPPSRCSAKMTLWPRRHCPVFLSPKWSQSSYLNSVEKELQNTSPCEH